MSTTKVTAAPRETGHVTDPLTLFGLTIGWALIVLGILTLGLALTN